MLFSCNSINCEIILSLLFLDLCILPFTQVNGKYILKFTASARGLLVNQVFSYVGSYLYHEWRILELSVIRSCPVIEEDPNDQ